MSAANLILALDIGTSSTKTALFDATGQRVPHTLAQETYSLQVDHDGAAEMAVADLEQAVLRALGTTLAAGSGALRDKKIVAVATSCFWHSLLGFDPKRGEPTPIYTWADSRCRSDAQRLRSELRETAYHARTGCMLRTAYWPAKLRWLQRTGRAKGVRHWMSPAEWLSGRLSGSQAVSLSMASGTGLMNCRTGKWDPALLKLCRIDQEMLGPISDEFLGPESRVGIELPPLHRFPELREALWIPALGDGAASNLGSGAEKLGVAALNVGTSAALRMVAPRASTRLPKGLFCYRVDEQRYLLGGAISNAGNLRAWALKNLRLPSDPAILEKELAARLQPDHGLTVLPFWTGERAPSWPDEVGGTLTGMTYATTAVDLLQALTESTYQRLAQISDLLAPLAKQGLEIIVSGGIMHSAESMQRLANVLGRPVSACPEQEASLRGAAVHACQRLRWKVTPLAKGKVLRPHPATSRRYADLRRKQVELEDRMRSV